MTILEGIIKEKIKEEGFITIADFMTLALSHPEHGYYMKQDPFGETGDFTTAPEVSQVFGEILAVYIAQTWMKKNNPQNFQLIEMGPGRGTLMSDILRTIQQIAPDLYTTLNVALIETSPTLRDKQKETLQNHSMIKWASSLNNEMLEQETFVLGNELLDALPIHQFKKIDDQWHECIVTLNEKNILKLDMQQFDFKVPTSFENNNFYEYNPYAEELIKTLSSKDNVSSLFIDYGYNTNTGLKDTLQALYKHEYKPIFENIGDQDLTAHVNFSRLKEIVIGHKRKTEILSQSRFLQILGIEERFKQLVLNNPSKVYELQKDLDRLIGNDKMGQLFKVLIIE